MSTQPVKPSHSTAAPAAKAAAAPATPQQTATDKKPAETKQQKLARLYSARMQATATKIRLLGNLAAYEPTPAQAAKICKVLQDAVDAVKQRLSAVKQATEEVNFTLD